MFDWLRRKAASPENVSPDLWPQVVVALARDMASGRDRWFSEALSYVRQQSKIPIVQTELHGFGDYVVRAFQLLYLSTELSRHSYMSSAMGKDFVGLAYREICGTSYLEILPHVERYYAFGDDTRGIVMQFSVDLVHFLSGQEPHPDDPSAADAVTACVLLAYSLSTYSRLAVASAFGDEKSAESIVDESNRTAEKLAARNRMK